MAQSGVSAQVRRLETRARAGAAGPRLLDGYRTVTPTEAGTAVLPFARGRTGGGRGRAGGDRGALRGSLRGHVRVGMVTAGPSGHLDRASWPAFTASTRASRSTLTEGDSASLLGRRPRRDARPRVRLAGPDAARRRRDPGADRRPSIVAAVAPDHALARRDALTLDELAEHPADLPPARDRGPLDRGRKRLGRDCARRDRVEGRGHRRAGTARGARAAVSRLLPEPAAEGLHTLALGLRGQIAPGLARRRALGTRGARVPSQHARGSV